MGGGQKGWMEKSDRKRTLEEGEKMAKMRDMM